MSDCQRPNRPESLPPEHIPRVEELQTVSVLFKQLSDASRLRIFWLLCHCEACGPELAGIVELTPPAVAHHLRLLRSSHLLVSRREGKEVYYRAADTAQAQVNFHEVKMIPRIGVLDEYLEASIVEVRALVERYPKEVSRDWEELNRLFLAALEMFG